MAFSKIRLGDGREMTTALDGKKVGKDAGLWISPQHVAAAENRSDLS